VNGRLGSRLRQGGLELGLSVAVAVAALAIGFLFIAASGASLSDATEAFVDGGFGTRENFANTLSKTVPLVLVALGWILVYRAGRFHVGFPGQILIGGLAVSVVALELSLPSGLHLPLAVLAGALGGAAWAAITAWLWAKRGVNEILSTLLLNLIAIQVISWAVRGPLQQPDTPLPISEPLADTAIWPDLLADTTLKLDFLLIPLVVAGVAFLLARTTLGFRIRLVGTNSRAARFSGVSPTRTGVNAILLSGALAGVAGSSLLLGGGARNLTDGFDAGYGFQGIAVALLARNSPWGVIPAAFLFATLRQAGGVMEATAGVSSAVVDLTQGIVILLVLAATSLLHFARPRAVQPGSRPVPAVEAKAA
jgi:general nucleoside transport system permease protein